MPKYMSALKIFGDFGTLWRVCETFLLTLLIVFSVFSVLEEKLRSKSTILWHQTADQRSML
jgi:hypothetical protein